MGVPRAEAGAPSETSLPRVRPQVGSSLQMVVNVLLFLPRRPTGRCAEHNCKRVRMPALHATPQMSKHLPGQQVQAHHGRLQQQVGVSVGLALSSGGSWAPAGLEAIPRGAADHSGLLPPLSAQDHPTCPTPSAGAPHMTASTSVPWTLPHPVCRCPLDTCPLHLRVSRRCPTLSTKCPLELGSGKAQEPWARLRSEP